MKFRKKPVVIDAILWTGESLKEVSDFFGWRNGSAHAEPLALAGRP